VSLFQKQEFDFNTLRDRGRATDEENELEPILATTAA
jgi:hypothetical protein